MYVKVQRVSDFIVLIGHLYLYQSMIDTKQTCVISLVT